MGRGSSFFLLALLCYSDPSDQFWYQEEGKHKDQMDNQEKSREVLTHIFCWMLLLERSE